MGDCEIEYNIYLAGVILSLMMSFGVAIYRNKQRHFVDNPEHGKKFYTIMASIKIVLGVLLLTVLYPADCYNFQSAYGVIAIAIGIYWLALSGELQATNSTVDVVSEMPPMGKEVV